MSPASPALPFAPMLDEQTVLVLRRRCGQVVRGLAFAGSSLAMAAFLWLLLAGPGFGTDHASTVGGRGAMSARR